MSGTLFIPYGSDIYELVDEYGLDELCSTLVFECECYCGGVYYVDFDSSHLCKVCGRKVVSPLVTFDLV